jgi:hypothetical protein
MKHGRRDADHQQIVAWYRELHCGVADTADLGLGLPDLFVSAAGVCDAVEVKSADGELTAAQKVFVQSWRSRVWIVRTLDDVVAHNADMRRRARRVTPREVYA